MTQLRIPASFMRGGTSKVVVVERSARSDGGVGDRFGQVTIDAPLIERSGSFGHPSGTLEVGADARFDAGRWAITQVTSR